MATKSACTTFGVCTSLGFGADSIAAGLHRLDARFENTVGNQIALIWAITGFATVSISLGLRRGIRRAANVTFAVGLLIIFSLLFLDNTWFLLNSFVQSVGHYFQWILSVGFQTDAWQQLGLEFSSGNNLLIGTYVRLSQIPDDCVPKHKTDTFRHKQSRAVTPNQARCSTKCKPPFC